jgi:hypothetical protein
MLVYRNLNFSCRNWLIAKGRGMIFWKTKKVKMQKKLRIEYTMIYFAVACLTINCQRAENLDNELILYNNKLLENLVVSLANSISGCYKESNERYYPVENNLLYKIPAN